MCRCTSGEIILIGHIALAARNVLVYAPNDQLWPMQYPTPAFSLYTNCH